MVLITCCRKVLPPKLKDLSSENWSGLTPGIAALASASVISIASVVVSEVLEEEVEKEEEKEEEEEPGCLGNGDMANVAIFLALHGPSCSCFYHYFGVWCLSWNDAISICV